jgi:hypothetical protein
MSRNVGFSSDSGHIAALPRNNAQGHFQTHALQHSGHLFDHLVGGVEQRRRYFDAHRLGGLKSFWR